MSVHTSEGRRLIALQRYADAMIDLLTRIMRELPITPENASTAKIAHTGLKELQAHARACDPRGAKEKYDEEEARLMDAVVKAAVAEGDAEAGVTWDGRMYGAYRKTTERREAAVRALRAHRALGCKKES